MTAELTEQIHGAWRDSFQALNRDMPGIRGLIDVSKAWDLASKFLEPRNLEGLNWNDRDHGGIFPAFRLLAEAHMSEELLKHFYVDVEKHFYLVDRDVQKALRKIEESNRISAVPQVGILMSELFERLVNWQQAWAAPLAAFEDPSLRPLFQQTFLHHLHLHLPPSFPTHIKAYFLATLHSHQSQQQLPASPYPSTPAESPQAPTFPLPTAADVKPSPHLQRLSMLARFGPELTSIAYEEIEKKVRGEAKGEWGRSGMLRELRGWGRGVVGAWWEGFYAGHDNIDQIMKPIYSRLDYHVCKTMSDLRTTELFDIIVSHPDTLPALEDLKECLAKVDSRNELVNALKASNVKRLLHPGADTKDIITQYVSTIRCLRIVDPPGVLLQKVSEPIRRFLKNRPDTIRCIVASLVNSDDDDDILGGDLEDDEDGGIKPLQTRDDREEDYTDPNWVPEPVDAAPEFRSGKASDIISTLVSIYDTRDVIVKELQILLAQKLLAVRDYDLEKEIRTVEILKLRFGETALQVCEVMLKDLADSKRIDGHVNSEITTSIHPKIVSRLFWPTFQSTGLVVPGQLSRLQARYAKAYHQFKPDKRLRWLPQLGTVEVKLELEDRVVEVEASPLQASIIELFGETSSWNLASLTSKLGLDDELVVLNGINFWVNKGVLKGDRKGSDATWAVLETKEEGGRGGGELEMRNVVTEEESAIQSVESGQAEQMRVYWQFIQGMLTNFGSMSLDRIQSMLGFAPDYNRSLEQLGEFMEALRREGVVDRAASGEWVLR
ncbi:hypothetical protein BDY24DRAFT_360993 [Mrakia frigida]|uniref:anaphase promoting complex subunit 2 n=1 Tax=Mrakia frigida TaxID=29902 RepID=UPI003FCC0B12